MAEFMLNLGYLLGIYPISALQTIKRIVFNNDITYTSA